MAPPQIDTHPTEDMSQAAARSLRENRIDPKFHYVTSRQATLWRQVFLKHSPIHGNPEFSRIYRDAFAHIAERSVAKEIALIGLGCGTGMKELALFQQLNHRGISVRFSAIDVSIDLVNESVEKLVSAGAFHERSLVCDLSAADELEDWLAKNAQGLPRIYTFFGLVPNLAPSLVVRILQKVLRPGDILLASAHLAPVGEGTSLPEAMQSILPQYNNAETLAWISEILDEWEIRDQVEFPKMMIGEMENIPAFIAKADWKSTRSPLQLFHSLRYTPEFFEKLLGTAGFSVERLAITSCREEALYAIFQPPPT